MRRLIVDAKDLGKYESRLRRQIRITTPTALRKAGSRAVGLLREKSSAIKDLGAFQSGWVAKSTFSELEIWNAAPHAMYVEGGRSPGARPPPLAAILPWVIRHLGNPDLAWVVARNIGIRGIKPRPILKDDAVFEQVRSIVAAELRRAWDEAAQRAS